MRKKDLPAHEAFDEELARELVGKLILVGITHKDHEGNFVRRSQIFGRVALADRIRSICIRDEREGEESWFPPDTRGITPAPPGQYRNRATGEVVHDPDYLASWTITAPEPKSQSQS